MLKAE